MAKTLLSSAAPIALLPSKATTIADVIERIAADTSLPLPRRQSLGWGLQTMVKATGQSADRIPANLATLRSLTTGFHPEHAMLSRKSWNNAWSYVSFALKHLGLTGAGKPPRVLLLPDWQHLLDSMANAGLRDWHLQRLAHSFSDRGLGPEQVSDGTLPLYHQDLVEQSRRNDPDRVVRRTARLWNKVRRLVPGLPRAELTVLNRNQPASLPLEAYPASFQSDVAAFLEWSGDNSPFRQGSARPVTAATLRLRGHQMRGLASALVLSDLPKEEITSLVALSAPERASLALAFMWQRNGEKTSSHIHGHAVALTAIARYQAKTATAEKLRRMAIQKAEITTVTELRTMAIQKAESATVEELRTMADQTVKELRTLAAGLKPKQRGLTEKNRRRLRQLDDPRNKALLLHLPRRLQVEAEDRGAPDPRGARLMKMAVAIELLQMCMLRRANLVNLDADRHFRWSRAGRMGTCHLAIEAAEVKNREPLEFELPQETGELVKLYLDHYQPLLGTTPSSWLFPGRTGQRPQAETGFTAEITDCIFSRTGLTINPHLFRHIGAKLHLDAQPGSYEVLRRVFGHRSMATTAETYCGLEMMAAARHVDEGILAQRRATRPLLLRRNRRRPAKPLKAVKPVKPVKPVKKDGV